MLQYELLSSSKEQVIADSVLTTTPNAYKILSILSVLFIYVNNRNCVGENFWANLIILL